MFSTQAVKYLEHQMVGVQAERSSWRPCGQIDAEHCRHVRHRHLRRVCNVPWPYVVYCLYIERPAAACSGRRQVASECRALQLARLLTILQPAPPPEVLHLERLHPGWQLRQIHVVGPFVVIAEMGGDRLDPQHSEP